MVPVRADAALRQSRHWHGGAAPPPELPAGNYRADAGLNPNGSAFLGSLADADAKSLHFPIEVAAFEAEDFRGAAHVAVAVIDFFQDVFTLVGVAGLVE